MARTFQVRGLNQGTVTIISAPIGSERLPNVVTADITVAKSFELPRGAVTVDASFFNVANANTVTAINTASGSRYNTVANFLSPRIYRFGIRYQF